MAYDALREVTVLFGGYNGTSLLGDLWEWNGTTWTQRTAPGPTARAYHSMVYDSHRGATVIFGGQGSTGDLNDTWEWNGLAWAERTSMSLPSRQSDEAMAYDFQRGVTVLNGIHPAIPTTADTREWNGIAWAFRSSGGPSPRSGQAMAFDPQRGVVLFGGNGSGTYLSDTWELQGQCTVPTFASEPQPRSICPGATTTFSAPAVTGNGPYTYQWELLYGAGELTVLTSDDQPLACGGSASAFPQHGPTTAIFPGSPLLLRHDPLPWSGCTRL